MKVLLDPKNYFLGQLKQLLQQCLGRLQLSEVQPPEYRSKLYFVETMTFKLENNVVESLNSAHNALLCHPYDDTMESLILFVDHSNFHSTLQRSLLNDIKQRPLSLVDITPPTKLMNLNFLKRTERLIMLKKYERSILRRMAESDPVQAAYSYIDLILAVSGSYSLFATNLIICLYFFKTMNNPKATTGELYAYRSIVYEISFETFLVTRHHVSLYIQMYLYKLLYTVIVRSSELFAKRITTLSVQKRRTGSEPLMNGDHERLLDELLKNIVHLSKVTPFTHAPPTALVHDTIYLQCAGNEFLSKYLKLMSPRSTMYRYYFFEAIWKGWIDDENFNQERKNCMGDFLD
ncbi:unnamed protein product, partial [Didymodactylos carnosus]